MVQRYSQLCDCLFTVLTYLTLFFDRTAAITFPRKKSPKRGDSRSKIRPRRRRMMQRYSQLCDRLFTVLAFLTLFFDRTAAITFPQKKSPKRRYSRSKVRPRRLVELVCLEFIFANVNSHTFCCDQMKPTRSLPPGTLLTSTQRGDALSKIRHR
jgi:hypothetical protein